MRDASSTSIHRRSQQLNIPMRFHLLNKPAIDLQKMPMLTKEIIFSDEARFGLCGYVNKQNYRIWGTENPHACIKKPTHLQLVTVWYGFWSISIIGRYSQWRLLSEEDIGNIWFQQEGAMCRTAEATLDVLRTIFEDRIISRRVDVVWPVLNRKYSVVFFKAFSKKKRII